MSSAWTVTNKEWIEFRAQTSNLFAFVAMIGLWLANIGFVTHSLSGALGTRGSAMLVESAATHQLISSFLIVQFILLQSVYSKEKLVGTLEALLSTPISVRNVWLGKTLFLSLAGAAMAMLLCGLTLIEINLLTPGAGGLLLPSPVALGFAFGVFPVLAVSLSGMLGVIQLASKRHGLVGVLYFFLGFGYLALSSARLNKMILDGAALAGFAAAAVILAFVAWTTANRLDREKVVLGSR